jgi:hypothetical protein
VRRTALGATVVVLAGLAVGGGFAVHERQHRAELVSTSEQACAGQDRPTADAPAQLPAGLPLTRGGTVLRVASQGRTVVAFASLPGGRGDIVAVRDTVLADLRSAGYTVAGTDQEPGYEAEAELAGTHEGTLKVAPLCAGLLEVRYKIDG